METIHGAASYSLDSEDVQLRCTRQGGQLGPVRFRLGDRWVSPYSLAPWRPDDCQAGTPTILRVLRGDFFCLPFGEHPDYGIHGQPANGDWQCEAAGPSELRLALTMTRPAGRVHKRLSVRPGQPAVYQEHVVEGVDGFFNFGYHAIIQFPETGGPFFVNTSPFTFGATFPGQFSDPAKGERGSLAANRRFDSLAKVPLAAGGTVDLHQQPALEDSEDLIMVASADPDFAWTAVTLDGYAWISLKNPAILPSTLFWMSNGGRPFPPWNDLHRRRIGLEEVNSYFCCGVDQARQDLLRSAGIPSGRQFSSTTPTRIPSIHTVVAVPTDFGVVREVVRAGTGQIELVGNTGQRLSTPVDWQFLYP